MVFEVNAGPEARQILQSLSTGEPDALPTKQAKSALERLSKGGRSVP